MISRGRVLQIRTMHRAFSVAPGRQPGKPGSGVGARASLLEAELQRCADGAAVLRVGAQTQLQLTFADLQSFIARLRELKKMPPSGGDLRQFLEKAGQSRVQTIPQQQQPWDSVLDL